MMSRYPEPLHGCARVGNIQGLKHQHYIRIQNYSNSTLNWSGEIQLQVLNRYSKHVKYICLLHFFSKIGSLWKKCTSFLLFFFRCVINELDLYPRRTSNLPNRHQPCILYSDPTTRPLPFLHTRMMDDLSDNKEKNHQELEWE